MPDSSTGSPTLRWHGQASAPDARTLASISHTDHSDVFARPLMWLDGDFQGETWQLEDTGEAIVSGQAHGWFFRRCANLAFASLHIDDGEQTTPDTIQDAARQAYTSLFALQAELGLPQLQRVWHWLSSLTAGDGDDQRYQRFCRGRAEALDLPGHSVDTLPPATLVSCAPRGVRLHALLGDTPVEPIENPRQVSAYQYPRDYGVRAPAFARGGVVQLGATRYLLISGTASIVGHESRHIGDVNRQADEAMNNLAAVIDAAAPSIGAHALTDLECVKAYLRNPDDHAAVQQRVAARMPGVPIALLHAPLCRDDLLVEFEAQLRIDR